MHKELISSEADIDPLLARIREAERKLAKNLQRIAQSGEAGKLLHTLKFEREGFDPLSPQNEYNIVEQVNQSFSYCVGLEGIRYLLKEFPGKQFYLNYGTSSGFDVESTCETVVAECFAARTVGNNNKLKKDIEKLSRPEPAKLKHKYIFFYVHKGKISERLGQEAKKNNITLHPITDLSF